MADLSKITLPDGNTYNFKDEVARVSIPYGYVDSTSTSTAFTATVPGVTSYYNGLTILLYNGVVTSASGYTININNLGAYGTYNNMTMGYNTVSEPKDPTRDTTIFNIAYAMLLVFCTDIGHRGITGWICYRGYDANMTILSYGHSTWDDFITAYNTNTIVYCRASTGSNPASGSQTRLAFMAYVNSETTPTNVEFQYYRSVNTHSDSQQGDQTYVYKLDKTSGWTVTVRENYSKIEVGTGLAKSYANSTITLSVTNGLPAVTSSDNGKILKVVDGEWTATNLVIYNGEVI